jgi:hypothetical protein
MLIRLFFVLAIGLLAGCVPAVAFDIKAQYTNDTARQRHFALFFVHGLGGDPSSTFGSWINVVRADKLALIDETYGAKNYTVSLSDFDIFVADYPTKETEMSIVEIGQQFADEIEAANSIFRQYDMIFVVAHSLGGLALHQAFELLVARNHPIWFRFLPAVLELGVPVNGSIFAEAAESFPSGVKTWLGYNPGLVKELKTKSDYLDDLNKTWAEIITNRTRSDGWPSVYCGYETKQQLGWWQSEIAKVWGISDARVVPPIYSSSVCNTGSQSPISTTHIDLTKVQNENDDAHKLLRRMVQETLYRIKDRRYSLKDKSADLYGTLRRIADASSSPTAVDRDTGVRLYKERIQFNDPGGATKSVPVDGEVAGWSVDDAMRRVAGAYPCLAVADQGGVIKVDVIPGVPCRP